MTLSLRLRAALVSIAILFVALSVWELSIPAQKAVGELTEYELPMGGAS
ncbi:MAG: nitrate/nitrite transport system permease protein [Paracoccaceae bacterium]|jgi:nitrate/nitrite transport system permease protein